MNQTMRQKETYNLISKLYLYLTFYLLILRDNMELFV